MFSDSALSNRSVVDVSSGCLAIISPRVSRAHSVGPATGAGSFRSTSPAPPRWRAPDQPGTDPVTQPILQSTSSCSTDAESLSEAFRVILGFRPCAYEFHARSSRPPPESLRADAWPLFRKNPSRDLHLLDSEALSRLCP